MQLYRHVKLLDVALFHHKNIMQPKSGSHFIGQKRNKINRFSPISQYSNQVFENEEHLAIKHRQRAYKAVLVVRNNFKVKSITHTS